MTNGMFSDFVISHSIFVIHSPLLIPRTASLSTTGESWLIQEWGQNGARTACPRDPGPKLIFARTGLSALRFAPILESAVRLLLTLFQHPLNSPVGNKPHQRDEHIHGIANPWMHERKRNGPEVERWRSFSFPIPAN